MNYNEQNFNNGQMNRSKDLVLAINEYVLIQDKTDGKIRTCCGPKMVTISQQQALVVFNSKTKKFDEVNDFERAKQLFVSAPEGWYVTLKNPTLKGNYPVEGINNPPDDMKIGVKVNIPGPTSFALFPGQMAKVVRGHKLRSNQYLLARVYDAAAAMKSLENATVLDAEGNVKDIKNETYFAGQLLVIKGTEVSFYIPPTGIEVVADEYNTNEYVREAVTLERLEYAILKDESGEKTYAHGPAVVFPTPTQTFVTAPKGGIIFRALELSPISGIYVKVIAEYTDTDKNGKTVKHPVGEELFITGNDQMIYYPRPEHAMIQYDGKYMHHAIAIPEGEGRYILNRLDGKVKTIVGPAMYLPDPRTEVVVKRKLTAKECELFYPNNQEALAYNLGLSEKTAERQARDGKTNRTDIINNAYSTSNQEAALAIFEANANISRGVSYTKPRTITLDTKYDGVVTISPWTGYAVNVVSKSGKREVVVGPATRLLDYDETLEQISLSTGKPKSSDRLISTAYLRVDNNKVSDIITVQTSDYVDVNIKVSYCVDFLPEYKDKWFSVDNYVKYLCDRMRSELKSEAKKHAIEEFYAKTTEIVKETVLQTKTEKKDGAAKGRIFSANGMCVTDVEVLDVAVEQSVAKLLDAHQREMIQKTLELSTASKRAQTVEQLATFEKREAELRHINQMYTLELEQKAKEEMLKNNAAINAAKRAEEAAATKAREDMQPLLNAIQAEQLKRDKAADAAKIATEKELAAIEKAKMEAYANEVAKIYAAISPDLVAAMQANANADLANGIGKAVAPYALAGNESVADVVQKILRGTTLEDTLKNIGAFKND